MMKELCKKNLEMDNEKIRKRRELKTEKGEVGKLQVQLDDLLLKDQKLISDSDNKFSELEEELEIKQRRLKNIQGLIMKLKEESNVKKEKSMSKANKMVKEIGEAIDNIHIPERPVGTKAGNRTRIYHEPTSEEEKIPIAIKVGEIFTFTGKEALKVISEREKAELEYRLISGLKNNLHKENVKWKHHMNHSEYRTRSSLAEIQTKMEDQSTALESERRDLTNKIEK